MSLYPTTTQEGRLLFDEWVKSPIGQAVQSVFKYAAIRPIFDVAAPTGWSSSQPSDHQTHAIIIDEIPDGAVAFLLPIDDFCKYALEGDAMSGPEDVPREAIQAALEPYDWWLIRAKKARNPWILVVQPKGLAAKPRIKELWGYVRMEAGRSCGAPEHRPRIKWVEEEPEAPRGTWG